jgi:two-component system, chemotaxis family, chemotaxis protein CheY
VAASGLQKIKILIIDDNDHMRRLLRAMLYAFGFKNVHGEEDGRGGFAALQRIKPDIVVTDYAMHPVNGVDFVMMVRALPAPMAWIPVIMVTGHNERHYVERARDAGITELLCKPVTAKNLFLRIREVIERPRQFVRAPEFAGPDRRRKRLPPSMVMKRRHSDFDMADLEFQ